jgi:hypothetical protein
VRELGAIGIGLGNALASNRVLALDVGLELTRLDAPLIAPAHLNRRQVAGTDQRIGLHLRDVQQLLDVRKGEESLDHTTILARTRFNNPLSTAVA